MSSDPETDRGWLTRAEKRALQQAAARQGFAIDPDRIRTHGDHLEAPILGLSDETAEDMLAFLERRVAEDGPDEATIGGTSDESD